MGKRYLEHAKKMKEIMKDKQQKVKLFDINLKNIDYVPEIVQKIARNTGDLSRKPPTPP